VTAVDDEDLAREIILVRDRIVRRQMLRAERDRTSDRIAARLTGLQHLTLTALTDGPLTVSDVATATGVAISTATRMLQGLTRLGLVTDARVPDADRRRHHVELTSDGRAVVAEKDAILAGRVRELIADLSDVERADLRDGLRVMARILGRSVAEDRSEPGRRAPA